MVNQAGTTRADEIWVCAHTRKCQWQGRYEDLIDQPCRKIRGMTKQVCPKCKNDAFYVRKTPALVPLMGWDEMTAPERNNYIGDLIKAPPLTQLYLALDGKMLWLTPKQEKDLVEFSGWVADWQRTKKAWKQWQKTSGELLDDWRGRITVQVQRWHIRYSDTPGGGWDVVEAIGKLGWQVKLEAVWPNWRITCDDLSPHHGRVIETAPTMQEAACLAAMRCFRPGAGARVRD